MSSILTLNAGSSSIKFSVYAAGTAPQQMAVGQVENLGAADARLTLRWQDRTTTAEIGPADHDGGVQAILSALAPVLDGADLTEANLTRADMTGASARGANFKNTILNKTIMRGVDLTGALNITVDQLADALIDDTTILPNYIDRAAVERLQRARRGGLL